MVNEYKHMLFKLSGVKKYLHPREESAWRRKWPKQVAHEIQKSIDSMKWRFHITLDWENDGRLDDVTQNLKNHLKTLIQSR